MNELLRNSNLNGPATGRRLGGLALLGIGVLMIGLGVYLWMSPKLYLSFVRLKVERNIASGQATNDPSRLSADIDPIQIELEVVRSEIVLRKVIDSLELKREWGKKYNGGKSLADADAMELLRRRLELRPVRNTSIIEIRFTDENPQEAAAIADRIAETYREYRMEDEEKKEKAEHSRKVEAMQKEVDRLRVECGIPDPNPRWENPTPILSLEVVKQLQSSLEYLTDAQMHLETQLTNLLKVDKSELLEVIQTALEQPDGQLNTLLNELDLAEQRLRFTRDGDQYVAMKSNVLYWNEKIDKRIDGILLGLQNRIDATQARVIQLSNRLEVARSKDLVVAEKQRPYYEAKQRLMESVTFRSFIGGPPKFMVYIGDKAEPSLRPLFPNRRMAAMLIGLGVLLTFLGIGLSKQRRVAV